MAKKLYVVTVSHSAYVLADSWNEATDFCDAIVKNEIRDTDIYEANGNGLRWFDDALVYHANDGDVDITLADALKDCPAKD